MGDFLPDIFEQPGSLQTDLEVTLAERPVALLPRKHGLDLQVPMDAWDVVGEQRAGAQSQLWGALGEAADPLWCWGGGVHGEPQSWGRGSAVVP